MRRLAEVGLVELTWKAEQIETKREKQTNDLSWDEAAGVYQAGNRRQVPVRRAVEKRAVRLAPLGAVVVERLRLTLESGERIRWSSIIDRTL
jgi:hypothetical protein